MSTIDTDTRLCAVIGNPVGHSLSPAMHNAAFQEAGLNYVYVAFRVEDIAGCIAGMRALPSFRGMSVTIPHKMAVMSHLDEIDELARNVGCVNTVTNENGYLVGTTTDGPGTLRAFREAGVSFDGRRVLFIGSGGAVRAVAFAIAQETAAEAITILGRTPERVAAIVEDLAAKTPIEAEPGPLDALPEAMEENTIVIQGTPVGMYPHEDETAVPRELFRRDQVVFDMVYRPHETRFLAEARHAGCTVIHGVEMLINQAVLQFERWTGVQAPVEAMRSAVLAELA